MTTIGIHPNIPASVYHAWPNTVSQSLLKRVLVDPSTARQPLAETEAMKLGTAFHTYVLEPDNFFDEVHPSGFEDLRSNAAKEERDKATSDGKIWLSKKAIGDLCRMRDQLQAHRASEWLVGDKELSMCFETGVRDIIGRGRVDCVHERDGQIYLVDLKTMSGAASTDEFQKAVNNYDYHMQAAYYLDGYEAITGDRPAGFIWVCVSKSLRAPVISVHRVSNAYLTIGRERIEMALHTYADCLESGEWPSQYDGRTVIELDPQGWLANQHERDLEIFWEGRQ